MATLPVTAQLTPNRHQLITHISDHHGDGRIQHGPEERRALLEQRRVVVRQLRRLVYELTDLDRQLDQIKRSER